MQRIATSNIGEIFEALDRQIGSAGGEPVALVVIGGTALAVLGYVSRTTKDVDVLGELASDPKHTIREIRAFPDWLVKAAKKVRRDFNLPDNWLNFGPTAQIRTGLPEGFRERLTEKKYGNFLRICFCDRLDQIHFKLYASIDRGGYHVEDLAALNPSVDEILKASRWVLTQDVSFPFKELLKDFLRRHGYRNAAEGI